MHQLENERETLLMDLEKLEREHSQYENNSTAAKVCTNFKYLISIKRKRNKETKNSNPKKWIAYNLVD